MILAMARPGGEGGGAGLLGALLPFLLMFAVLYFLLIGWWLSALWMEVAYALCLSIIGLPIGFWMFDQVPALLTLRQ